MTAIMKMTGVLLIEEGARLYYNPPSMSMESFSADKFFKKYGGKEATVTGFVTELVGPLDDKGRIPGEYHKTDYALRIRFDGDTEIHSGLNMDHFIVISPTNVVQPKTGLWMQRVGDLPNAIQFYAGDLVHKGDDLLKTPRLVQEISIADDGSCKYILSETEDDRVVREAEKEARRAETREKGDMFMMGMMFDHERTEVCIGESLILLERGNVRYLYEDPSKMAFDDIEDEIRFWSQDGISKTVYKKDAHIPSWEYRLDDALALIKSGNGDVIVRKERFENIRVIGEDPKALFLVRKLHDCFSDHRDHVVNLVLEAEDYPDQIKHSFGRMAKRLFR